MWCVCTYWDIIRSVLNTFFSLVITCRSIFISLSLLFFCLSVCLSVSLSYPSVCLSPILLSVCLSLLSFCLSPSPIPLSVYPISLSFCLSLSPIPLSVYPNLLSACLSYPSVCLSLLSLCLSILSPRPSVYICLPVCFSTPLTATHKDKWNSRIFFHLSSSIILLGRALEKYWGKGKGKITKYHFLRINIFTVLQINRLDKVYFGSNLDL